MKKILQLLLIMAFFTLPFTINAQHDAPPPPPGGDRGPGGGGPPVGGNAPIGGGLFILLGLGAAYGGKKVYNLVNTPENID